MAQVQTGEIAGQITSRTTFAFGEPVGGGAPEAVVEVILSGESRRAAWVRIVYRDPGYGCEEALSAFDFSPGLGRPVVHAQAGEVREIEYVADSEPIEMLRRATGRRHGWREVTP
jgi:hypothetical protein